jgi:hypothetical protein
MSKITSTPNKKSKVSAPKEKKRLGYASLNKLNPFYERPVKRRKVALFALVVLAAVGGGAYAYLKTRDIKDPQKIYAKLNEVNSEHAQYLADNKKQAEGASNTTHIHATVKVKKDWPAQLKQLVLDDKEIIVDATMVAIDSLTNKADIHLKIGDATADLKYVIVSGKTAYFLADWNDALYKRLETLTVGSDISALKDIKGQWYNLSGFSGLLEQQAVSLLDLSKDLGTIYKILGKTSDGTIGSQAQTSAGKGADAYGLNVLINKEAYIKLLKKAEDMAGQKASGYKNPVISFIEKTDFEKYPLTLYVDKDFNGSIALKYEKDYPDYVAYLRQDSYFQKDQTVSEPTSSKTFLELIGALTPVLNKIDTNTTMPNPSQQQPTY